MICLLQRVSTGSVAINKQKIAEIEHGLVVLCAFQQHDDVDTLTKMADKLIKYRLFSDENDKTNLTVQQVAGELLLVPQFTLAADTRKGLRPSFHKARAPSEASVLFQTFCDSVASLYPNVQTGKFGKDMSVTIINEGPMTFWLEN